MMKNLSIPELDLIIRMADLFDISADVLLGYEELTALWNSLVEQEAHYEYE